MKLFYAWNIYKPQYAAANAGEADTRRATSKQHVSGGLEQQ